MTNEKFETDFRGLIKKIEEEKDEKKRSKLKEKREKNQKWNGPDGRRFNERKRNTRANSVRTVKSGDSGEIE